MRTFLIISLVGGLSVGSLAARVQVQERDADASAGVATVDRGEPRYGYGGGSVERETVQPASKPHWWNRQHANRPANTAPGRVNTTARVSVVNSPGWHNYGGRRYRYSYYGGHPWYGFYVGPHYYWSRWYGNRWWWYDTAFARWSFWYGGYWWYSIPGGVTYVYVNDTYVPYQPGLVAVAPPAVADTPPTDVSAPPPGNEQAAVSPASDQTANSPDGRRMVQIAGPNSEAFLYDTSSGTPVFMRYLAKDVLRVRFDGGRNGKPIQILVDYKTNSDFTLFDIEGNAQGGSVVPSNTQPVQPPAAIPG